MYHKVQCDPGIYQVNVGSSIQSSKAKRYVAALYWWLCAWNLLQGELHALFIVPFTIIAQY